MKMIVRCLPLVALPALAAALGVFAPAPPAPGAPAPRAAAGPRARTTHSWTTPGTPPLLPVHGTDPTGGGHSVGPCAPVPGCACSEVRVSCGDTGGSQFAGSTNGCDIVLTPGDCARLGIVPVVSDPEGHTYLPIDPTCWLDPINALPDFTGMGQVNSFCLAQHEARHACGDANIPDRCAAEQAAYGETLTCLNRIWDAKCNELGPGEQAGYCDEMASWIATYRGISALEQCLCETSDACDDCILDCQWYARGLGDPSDHETVIVNCYQYGLDACEADQRF